MTTFADNAIGTLNASILSGDSTLTLSSGQGSLFPSSYPFDLLCESEYMICTGKSSDTLTVTRGAYGSSAAGHASGKAVVNVITANFLNSLSSPVLLDDYTVSGSVIASYDTNTRLGGNIPNGYKHLKLEMFLRGDAVTTSLGINGIINNDSGGNYTTNRIISNGSAASGSASTGNTSAFLGYACGSSGPANNAGIITWQIYFYNNTTFYKQSLSDASIRFAATSYNYEVNGHEWSSTSGITRLAVTPASGNFIVGCQFRLSGIP